MHINGQRSIIFILEITMSKFRLEDIVNVTFANTDFMKQKRIRDTYGQLQQSMLEANAADESQKQIKQQAYLKAYISVMEQMNQQVSSVRDKYLNLDKEQLKNEKCEQIAEEIKLFREQSYLYQKKVKESQERLGKQKLEEQLLIKQKQAYIEKIKQEKKNVYKLKYHNEHQSVLDSDFHHVDNEPKHFQLSQTNTIYNLDINSLKRKRRNSEVKKNEPIDKIYGHFKTLNMRINKNREVFRPKTARYLETQKHKRQTSKSVNVTTFRALRIN